MRMKRQAKHWKLVKIFISGRTSAVLVLKIDEDVNTGGDDADNLYVE